MLAASVTDWGLAIAAVASVVVSLYAVRTGRATIKEQAGEARRLTTIEAKRSVYADVIRVLEDASAILDLGSDTNLVPSGELDDRVRHARALVLVLGGPVVQSRYADAAEAVRSSGSVRADGSEETNPTHLHANVQERIQALAEAMRTELD